MTLGSPSQKSRWSADSEKSQTEGGILPRTARRQHRLGLLSNAAKGAFVTGGKGLKQVEERMQSRLCSDAPVLAEISRYLLELGGKRIRPLLTLLCAKLYGMKEESGELIDAAAGIELIHMATLLHDDIIDESPIRRSQQSAYLKFGMPPTLLAGDFLFARAFGLCAALDSFVVTSTEQAVIELTEGEVLEGHLDCRTACTLDQYLDIVAKKTGSLFALSAAVGSHLAGAEPSSVERMRSFGLHTGVAFQMIDDILDVHADESLLGKPAGTDLRQRTPSLINILWLASGDPAAAQYFAGDGRESGTAGPAMTWEEALQYLKQSPVVEHARELASKRAALARALLETEEERLIDPRVREQLLAILEYTLERCL